MASCKASSVSAASRWRASSRVAKAIIGVLAMGLLWRSALSGMAAVAASCAAGLVTYLLLTLPLLDRKRPRSIADTSPTRPCPGPRCASANSPEEGVPGVVRYSVTALVTYGLLALMLSSDTLIAKHYLSNHQAGLYAGVSLAGKIAYFAASSLFVVAFPVFSRHHDQGIGSGKWILAAGGMVCATAGSDCDFSRSSPPGWSSRFWATVTGQLKVTSRGWLRFSGSTPRLPRVHLPARPQAPGCYRRAGCRPGRAVRRVFRFPLDDHPDDGRAGGRFRGAARRRDAAGPARRGRTGHTGRQAMSSLAHVHAVNSRSACLVRPAERTGLARSARDLARADRHRGGAASRLRHPCCSRAAARSGPLTPDSDYDVVCGTAAAADTPRCPTSEPRLPSS